jgi:predicted enzyme related to lactoylglutathione lyase
LTGELIGGRRSFVASFVENIVFDCVDAYRLARFWSKVVAHPLSDDDSPGDPETSIVVSGGPTLCFQRVPEPKTVKNRVHVCLQPDTTRDAEVERLVHLGATMVDDRRHPDGTGWAVLADPERNEFCVLRGVAEREHPSAFA